jgi:hypothetical protein
VSALERLSRAHQDLTRTSLGLGALRALLSLGPELWMVRGVLAEDVDRVLVGLAAWLAVELTAGAWIDARLGAEPRTEPRTDATRIALVRGLIPWLWCLAPGLVLATRIFARDGWTPPELVRPVLVTAVGTLVCATIGLRQHLAHAQAYARRPSEPAAPTPSTSSAPAPSTSSTPAPSTSAPAPSTSSAPEPSTSSAPEPSPPSAPEPSPPSAPEPSPSSAPEPSPSSAPTLPLRRALILWAWLSSLRFGAAWAASALAQALGAGPAGMLVGIAAAAVYTRPLALRLWALSLRF